MLTTGSRIAPVRRLRMLVAGRDGLAQILVVLGAVAAYVVWYQYDRHEHTAATQKTAADTQRLERPPFCSQACVASDRIGGGVDPVAHLADHMTLPADLARSPFYRYLFTLLP